MLQELPALQALLAQPELLVLLAFSALPALLVSGPVCACSTSLIHLVDALAGSKAATDTPPCFALLCSRAVTCWHLHLPDPEAAVLHFVLDRSCTL